MEKDQGDTLSINDLVMWEKRYRSLSQGAATAGSLIFGINMVHQSMSSGKLKPSVSYIPGCVAYGISLALSYGEYRLQEVREKKILRLLERPVERS